MKTEELKELSKAFILKIDDVIGSLEKKVEENQKNTNDNTKRLAEIERVIEEGKAV